MIIVLMFILAAASHPFPVLAAADSSPPVTKEQADAYYQNGNCVKSMLIYRSLYHQPDASSDLKDLIRFRSSFCYLELNQNGAAKKGFEEFLKTYPNHDEARLKYSEALFRIQDYRAARDNALKVKDPERLPDARLVAAHSDMALGEYKAAIYHLNSTGISEAWLPVFDYWKGVAAYRYGELRLAREHFEEARNGSSPDHWAKAKAQEWLTQLEEDLRVVKARASIGYFYDGNIGQQSVLPADSRGEPTLLAPNPASYTKDHGLNASVGLTFLLRYTRPFRLYSSLDASSPFYKENRAYNLQTFSLGLTAVFHLANNLDLSLTSRASQGRYQFLYYQNYLNFDHGLSWNPTDSLRLDFSLGYSRQVRSRPAATTSFSLGATYGLAPWLYLSGGASTSRTKGDVASYSTGTSGYPVLVRGTMFSSYTSRSLTIGPNIQLPKDVWLKLAYTRSWTNYEKELVPTYRNNTFPARIDSSTTYFAELSRHVVPNRWYVSASYAYSENRSSGFQGLASSVISSYSYDRPIATLSTTVYY